MGVFRIQCECGQWLEVTKEHIGKRCTCVRCGREIEVVKPPDAVEGPAAAEAPGPLFPWMTRGQAGHFQAALATIKGVLLSPDATFCSAPASAKESSYWSYFLIMGAVFVTLSALINFGMQAAGMAAQQKFLEQLNQLGGGGVGRALAMQKVGLLGAVFMIPVQFVGVIIGLVIGAALNHLVLMIFGAAQAEFEATLMVAAFVSGSTMPLWLVPGCGQLIAGIWGIVCTVIGLKVVHRTSTGKAIAAVLLPGVVCCCVPIALLIGIGAFAAAAAG